MHPAPRPTVVLLHSSASSARQWDSLRTALEPRFRVHAIDLHGHGEQAAWQSNAPLTLADEAALAVPLLEAAGGAHVVGHSYGAAVAVKLATMHPRWVRSLVAYEPVLFRWLTDDVAHQRVVRDVVEVARTMRNQLAAGNPQPAAQQFVDFWSGASAWASLPGRTQTSIAACIGAVLQSFDALFREPLLHTHLRALDIPMMFVSGAHTVAVMRQMSGLMREMLPRARHEVLPAMGHMGPITHAAEVNKRLADFLGEQMKADSTHAPALRNARSGPHDEQSHCSRAVSPEHAAQCHLPAGSRLHRRTAHPRSD